ncbi:hypothetical protein [Pseudomonas sp. CFSAN084952]|jgi:hypothetical protein|uniref:hypothetical protein n=1 Tax=Pseudomonas TaxID=286 RepID=UPI0021156490|nr:hypothetical protein [Pseudomonas sp. CFSAN084952]
MSTEMGSIDRVKLDVVVKACRRGLETLSDTAGSAFKQFPTGACGIASDIVGRILWEALGYEGVYVCATGHPLLSQNASHAWFEVDGLIIDITHDQFHGTELNGWVFAPEEGWYTLFEEQERRDGYSPPCEWLIYPSDGYDVACNEVVAQGITVADLQSY